MPTLTLSTAVAIANQVYKDHGYEYPWSFVAVPTKNLHELNLRFIHVDEGEERSSAVSYERGPHSFYAECSRIIAWLKSDLQRIIATKQRTPRDEKVAMRSAV